MSRRVAGPAVVLLASLAALVTVSTAALVLTAAADPQSPHWIDSPIEAPAPPHSSLSSPRPALLQ